MSETQQQIFDHQGVRIGVRDEGDGPVVAVLSGWGYGALMGEVAFSSLRESGYRVITFDLPGTGVLKESSAFVHVPRLARAVAAYLRNQNAVDATVIGHSFGTMVAQEMAISDDDVVGRLVLISPVTGVGGLMPDMNAAMDMLGRLMSGNEGFLTFLFPPSYLSKLRQTLGDVFEDLERPTSGAALSGQVWAATRWSTFGRMQSLYQNVLILHGDKDPLSPVYGAQGLARQLPKASLTVFEKCGYLPFLECKKETLAAVHAFLPKTSGKTSAK